MDPLDVGEVFGDLRILLGQEVFEVATEDGESTVRNNYRRWARNAHIGLNIIIQTGKASLYVISRTQAVFGKYSDISTPRYFSSLDPTDPLPSDSPLGLRGAFDES